MQYPIPSSSSDTSCQAAPSCADSLRDWMTPEDYYKHEIAMMLDRRGRRAALKAHAAGAPISAAEFADQMRDFFLDACRAARMGAHACEQLARHGAKIKLKVMISITSSGMSRELYGFVSKDGELVAQREGFTSAYLWLKSAREASRIEEVCAQGQPPRIAARL